jgi:mannose-6-phosphate isomerase
MFLPSGRVHAIGAGLVIFEIQQNSDTTFRVFDWNRLGLDGRPRELHVAESLESIDFEDYEPGVTIGEASRTGPFAVRPLVEDALFDVDLVEATARDLMRLPSSGPHVIAVAEGRVMATGGGVMQALEAGQFCLMPASMGEGQLGAEAGAVFLIARPK